MPEVDRINQFREAQREWVIGCALIELMIKEADKLRLGLLQTMAGRSLLPENNAPTVTGGASTRKSR